MESWGVFWKGGSRNVSIGRVASAMRIRVALVNVALLGIALLAFVSQARGDAGNAPVVNCYDQTRQVVQKMRRGDCQGAVVSAEEAARVGASRRDYVRRAFNEQRGPSLPGRTLQRIGTGFFVDNDGTVVTSRHVVENCAVVSVSPTTGDTVQAELVGLDHLNDLALLRTELTPPGVARVVQSQSPGVAMVGYPDQGIPPITPLLTVADMIGTETIAPGLTVLKLNADVRPGNSGGPLLDQKGNVVGVVFAEINTPGVYEQTGKIVRNIGFAIPGDILVAFISRWQIPYWKGSGTAETVAAGNLLSQARPYIARIGCWQSEQEAR
jgi:S1-C subfamily serine protease